jgi:hypothetical protein
MHDQTAAELRVLVQQHECDFDGFGAAGVVQVAEEVLPGGVAGGWSFDPHYRRFFSLGEASLMRSS